jgi:DNA-binding SARP family transcriptional activator
VRINILGFIEVIHRNASIDIHGQRQRAILAALVLAPDSIVPITDLIETIWGPTPPASATAKIYTHISALRSMFASDEKEAGWPILTRSPGYRLSAHVQTDLREYISVTEMASQAERVDQKGKASELYAQALGLWRGPALMDVVSDGVQIRAGALNALRLLTIERKAAADLELGRYARVVADLIPVVTSHPFRETARAELMLSLYLTGCRSDALEIYRNGAQLLGNELGVQPGPVLRKLHGLMLRDDMILFNRESIVEIVQPDQSFGLG